MKNKNDKGFTFIELILYMAILGIFMVAVVTLLSTTVASHRKQKSRQKLQTQATEVYDTISNMVMGAKEVKVASLDSSTSSVSKAYIVKSDESWKDVVKEPSDAEEVSLIQGGNNPVLSYIYDSSGDSTSVNSYNIEKKKSYIDTKYLYLSYSPETDKTAFVTIAYDGDAQKIYLYRTEILDADYSQLVSDSKSTDSGVRDSAVGKLEKYASFYDEGAAMGTVLANNVSDFKVKIDSEGNSVALVISFEDDNTGETYSVTGVVGIRNSFVLTQHEWN